MLAGHKTQRRSSTTSLASSSVVQLDALEKKAQQAIESIIQKQHQLEKLLTERRKKLSGSHISNKSNTAGSKKQTSSTSSSKNSNHQNNNNKKSQAQAQSHSSSKSKPKKQTTFHSHDDLSPPSKAPAHHTIPFIHKQHQTTSPKPTTSSRPSTPLVLKNPCRVLFLDDFPSSPENFISRAAAGDKGDKGVIQPPDSFYPYYSNMGTKDQETNTDIFDVLIKQNDGTLRRGNLDKLIQNMIKQPHLEESLLNMGVKLYPLPESLHAGSDDSIIAWKECFKFGSMIREKILSMTLVYNNYIEKLEDVIREAASRE